MHGDATRSWFKEGPAFSLDMFEKSAVTAKDSVIDIGGGAAALAGELLARAPLSLSCELPRLG